MPATKKSPLNLCVFRADVNLDKNKFGFTLLFRTITLIIPLRHINWIRPISQYHLDPQTGVNRNQQKLWRFKI
jgi:hypothetical protein